ncbi:MAG: DUF3789 domain-containing protein [Ruminococcus sp.]|nr:DUF3789 domain-containing protein [Ruminococcus sp.]
MKWLIGLAVGGIIGITTLCIFQAKHRR